MMHFDSGKIAANMIETVIYSIAVVVRPLT